MQDSKFDLKFEIKKNIITLEGDGERAWNLELNVISWNDRNPTYDIRKWSPDHKKMSKGLSLTEDEVIKLFQNSEKILNVICGEEYNDDVMIGEGLPF